MEEMRYNMKCLHGLTFAQASVTGTHGSADTETSVGAFFILTALVWPASVFVLLALIYIYRYI